MNNYFQEEVCEGRASKVKLATNYGCVGLIALAALGLIILVELLSIPSSNLLIAYERSTNSVEGATTFLRLANKGGAPIRINAYCTIYWTNLAGVETNRFYQHSPEFTILRPGESRLVTVPRPHDARAWDVSFGYDIRPNLLKRIYNKVRSYLPGRWAPNYPYSVRLSPIITNGVSIDSAK